MFIIVVVRWKPLYINRQFYTYLYSLKLPYFKNSFSFKLNKSKKQYPLIYDKSLTITKKLTGNKIYIYKGKLLRELFVPYLSIGLKLGEFTMTRKPFHFTPKIKKKK
jgi:ribosomal protein S19